jgi:hypothetical protein
MDGTSDVHACYLLLLLLLLLSSGLALCSEQ